MPNDDEGSEQTAVTGALVAWGRGEAGAADRLLDLVYPELHRIAEREMRRERAGHTLQPTAVVHEAYLKLVDQSRVDWRNRAHFMGVAAQAMRRLLVDHARGRLRDKRGGGATLVAIDSAAAEPRAPGRAPFLRRTLGRRERGGARHLDRDRRPRLPLGARLPRARARRRLMCEP